MPRIAVSITKAAAFRGGNQEFSNVYYYEVLNLPDTTQATTFIDNLTALEKTFHGAAVTFVRGRLWSAGAGAAGNNMIQQKTLSGTGARANHADLDRERAYLFRIRAGVDSRGNPVYLRKWYHACGLFSTAVTPGAGILENTSGFSTTERGNLVSAMSAIGDANGSPLTPKICSKAGRLPDAGAGWASHQFLEHHQLGDMWRG